MRNSGTSEFPVQARSVYRGCLLGTTLTLGRSLPRPVEPQFRGKLELDPDSDLYDTEMLAGRTLTESESAPLNFVNFKLNTR